MTQVDVGWGWSPSASVPCINVEARNTLGETVSTTVMQGYPPDCEPMTYEQLIAVPEQPSLALGLILLAATRRSRRRTTRSS